VFVRITHTTLYLLITGQVFIASYPAIDFPRGYHTPGQARQSEQSKHMLLVCSRCEHLILSRKLSQLFSYPKHVVKLGAPVINRG
jgi:hypothetical protein